MEGSQLSVAWQEEIQAMLECRFVPRVIQGSIRPQHILLLFALVLAAQVKPRQVMRSSLQYIACGVRYCMCTDHST